MMVLAVDVVGRGAGQGDEAGARRGGQKPALGHDQSENGVQTGAALGPQYAGLFVQGDETIQGATADQAPLRIQSAVAVGAAQTRAEHPAAGPRGLVEERRQILAMLGPGDPMHLAIDATPGNIGLLDKA